MIPLAYSEGVRTWPRAVMTLIIFWTLLSLLGWFFIDLPEFGFSGVSPWWFFWLASLFHINFYDLIVAMIFMWALMPPLFERYPLWMLLFSALSVCAGVAILYQTLFPNSLSPILGSMFILSVWLGMLTSRDIWGTVNTLVIGLGWIRVYQVPLYVLLFFWFFYLMIGQFFYSAPYSDAAMPYFLSFSCFVLGFVWALMLNGFLTLLTKLHNRFSKEPR